MQESTKNTMEKEENMSQTTEVKIESGGSMVVTEHDFLFSFWDGFSDQVYIAKLPEEKEAIRIPGVDLLEAVFCMLRPWETIESETETPDGKHSVGDTE